MPLLRAVPLKDATETAVSTDDVSTGYDLSAVISAGRNIYGGLHLLTCSGLGLSETFLALVQSASSSGFALVTTEFSFTQRTTAGFQFSTGVVVGSTDRKWFRARWDVSTGSAPSFKFLEWVSIQ